MIHGLRQLSWSVLNKIIRFEFPDVTPISTANLAHWLESPNPNPPLLLDTRTAEEFAVSHLAHAQRLDPKLRSPIDQMPFLKDLDRDTPIVTYCSVGYRSAAIARKLKQAGYTRVWNLEGSIFQWANEGRPIYRNGQAVHQVHPYNRMWGMLSKPGFR
ncbi:MAG TPA: rhodanese-like domain-containing protein [Crinalium sp.]|jgi:rhodanese-related sulfurtransferase